MPMPSTTPHTTDETTATDQRCDECLQLRPVGRNVGPGQHVRCELERGHAEAHRTPRQETTEIFMWIEWVVR